MAELSTFESRTGLLDCSSESAFAFMSDMRNFGQFIPSGSVSDIVLEKESCSFRVDMLGNVNLLISERAQFSRVVYSGTVPQVKDFSVTVEIRETGIKRSEARIILKAEINPFLKMMVAESAGKALNSIISGMEKFDGWPTDR
jgi:hypothetical protein